MNRTLSLRQQSRLEAKLRQRIGAGYCFYYQLDGEPGVLQLSLPEHEMPAFPARTFSCDLGELQLSSAESVCSLMSACPLLMGSAEEDHWYWPLFNQYLSEELKCLFGTLSSQAPAEHGAVGQDFPGLSLQLTVRLGEELGQSQLFITLNTLSLLLNKAGWEPILQRPVDQLPLTLPLTLGALSLSLEQLRTLKYNDVVLPHTSWFAPDGSGVLNIAQLRLEGELVCEEGHPAYFYITDLESTGVNLTPDDYAMEEMPYDPEEEGMDAPEQNDQSLFDPLPLALTLRCGHLKLTLGELNRLSVGSTVIADNVQPGEAILCHGDFPLAKGELVDVEGRLGLQITHMLPGAVNPLEKDR